MKIALKAILWANMPDKQGNCPIAIRITGGNAKTHYNTGIKCPVDKWDGDKILKGVDNYDIKNARLSGLLKDTEREILNRELQGHPPTLSDVKKMLDPDKAVKGGDFLKYAAAIIAEKEPPTKKRYGFELDKITAYSKGKLNFGTITPAWLSSYYAHLRGAEVNNSHNTAINAFKVIRLVFNRAIKDKITTLYPFNEWQYPAYKTPKKGYLQMSDCDKIFALLDKPVSADVKLVSAFFLLEAFGGLRVSDWGKFSIEKITESREMVFTTTKTKTDVRLPLESMPSLKRVVDYILANNLKFTRDGKFANDNLKTIKELIGVEMKLTTHVARHTFATMWLSKGMSRDSIALMMGITVKQVNTYAKFDGSRIKDEISRLGGL